MKPQATSKRVTSPPPLEFVVYAFYKFIVDLRMPLPGVVPSDGRHLVLVKITLGSAEWNNTLIPHSQDHNACPNVSHGVTTWAWWVATFARRPKTDVLDGTIGLCV